MKSIRIVTLRATICSSLRYVLVYTQKKSDLWTFHYKNGTDFEFTCSSFTNAQNSIFSSFLKIPSQDQLVSRLFLVPVFLRPATLTNNHKSPKVSEFFTSKNFKKIRPHITIWIVNFVEYPWCGVSNCIYILVKSIFIHRRVQGQFLSKNYPVLLANQIKVMKSFF